MDTDELIERLVRIPGPSGFEDAVAIAIRDALAGIDGAVTSDVIGNLVLTLPGPEDAPALMLMAHMDEVSLLVKHIDEAGLLYCEANGLIDERTLPAGRVQVWTEEGPVLGVVGAQSRHQVTAAEQRAPIVVNDLWIDVGARSREEIAALGIEIGMPATNFSPPARMAGGHLVSKAIDNRAGCAVLVQVAHAVATRPRDFTLQLVWAAQEEVGSRGARIAAQRLQPLAAVVVDTTPAGDPSTATRYATAQVGGGPVIRAQDARGATGTLYSRAVQRALRAAAETENIPYQLDVYPTWTDACEVHLAGRGVATGGLFLPRRCSHSPNEVADLADIERAIALLTRFTDLDAAAIEDFAKRPALPLVS
jgi:endoglucanase